MIKLFLSLTLLTSSMLIIPSSTGRQLTEPSALDAVQGLKDDDEIAKKFCCIDDSGTAVDDSTSTTSNSLLTRCARAAASAVTSMTKHCLTPKVSHFYNMSETDLDAFIKSKATASNEYEGYREIETAILDAINSEQLEEAILLFSKMSSKKPCFTRTALKAIHEAAGKYQQNIDRAFLQNALLYATRTARNVYVQDEATRVKASVFERQTPDSISEFSQKLLQDLRTFAAQNTNPATANLVKNNA